MRPQAIAEIRRQLERGHGPRNSGDFVAELADLLVDRMDDVTADVEAETHRVGHAGERGDTGELVGELARLRRRMMRLKCYLGPQRRGLSAPRSYLADAKGTKSRAVMEKSTGVSLPWARNVREISRIPLRAGVAGRTISIESLGVWLKRARISTGMAGRGRGSSPARLNEIDASCSCVADRKRMARVPSERLTVRSLGTVKISPPLPVREEENRNLPPSWENRKGR
jgi:hypothetical protein